jgi:hypothetical protein
VTKQIGIVEEWTAIQSVMSTWLRKGGNVKVFKGHMVRRKGGERSFSNHVNQEKR